MVLMGQAARAQSVMRSVLETVPAVDRLLRREGLV